STFWKQGFSILGSLIGTLCHHVFEEMQVEFPMRPDWSNKDLNGQYCGLLAIAQRMPELVRSGDQLTECPAFMEPSSNETQR
ncbi:hypothetical protein STEG23_029495, partial [Scotinomys teguina]